MWNQILPAPLCVRLVASCSSSIRSPECGARSPAGARHDLETQSPTNRLGRDSFHLSCGKCAIRQGQWCAAYGGIVPPNWRVLWQGGGAGPFLAVLVFFLGRFFLT